MRPRRYHVLDPLTEADSVPKGREILWKNELEVAFQDIKRTVSTDNLQNYPGWTNTFTIHTYASDKILGDFISQNDKPIALFTRKLIKPQSNYNTK